MSTSEELQTQTKRLLELMKSKQGLLQRSLEKSSSQSDPLTISDLKISDSLKAREVLKKQVKKKSNSKVSKNTCRLSVKQGTLNIDKMKLVKSSDQNEGEHDVVEGNKNNSANDSTPNSKFKSYKPTTPTSVRKRRDLIDRNVKIGNRYVHGENTDVKFDSDVVLLSHANNCIEKDVDFIPANQNPRHADYVREPKKSDDDRERGFYANLTNDGNSRKAAYFIRDTTVKPKSILNAPGPFGPKKRNGTFSKVSFRDSTANDSGRTSPSFLDDKTSKQLLGYDWIAGLIDNDPTVINQSESFFDELRDFRRVNRDECENKSYMEGPFCVSRESEPSSVKKALETKVKPFTINDRLFTVPVNNDWLASYVGEPTDDTIENKEPSYDAPRFVRVSIPRSTLVTPHRYKPHRRRSFDPTDSMALGEHCLKGWESSRPASMPTASNIALKDAQKGVKTKIATTLEEAEKIAASFYWPNSSPDPGVYTNHRLAKDTLLQLRYDALINGTQLKGDNPRLNATTGEIPLLAMGREGLSNSFPRNTGRQKDALSNSFPQNTGNAGHSTSFDKSSTDKLLDTTYSMMYEMQRLKQETDARIRMQNPTVPVA